MYTLKNYITLLAKSNKQKENETRKFEISFLGRYEKTIFLLNKSRIFSSFWQGDLTRFFGHIKSR
jgi:hypothetical protein